MSTRASITQSNALALARIVSVKYQNYKALRHFFLTLRSFNVLVGPNNAGKSTILGSFRILAEALRKASSRSPEPIRLDRIQVWGYKVPLDDLPISTENVFTDYDDSEPARVTFVLSNKNALELVFLEVGTCVLVPRVANREIRSSAAFKTAFPLVLGFVPTLGPVEHDEPLYQRDAARRALLSHGASRNFRNIWYHFPEDFETFRALIRSTWPGMDIELPKVSEPGRRPKLTMFCPEARYPREIYWSGFGFQVWCQLLTYALRSKSASLLVIDEPDIYLHSDLQRQLLSFLQTLGPDILIATHSTEILAEAEPASLLVINKGSRRARHVKRSDELQELFGILGSNLNPTLTLLAKSKRAVFVEGKDFGPIGLFARKLNRHAVANRSDFAVISSEGFAPKKIIDMKAGFAAALGFQINIAIVLDRDYRTDDDVRSIRQELSEHALIVHVHGHKEIENYILVPNAIQRAVDKRIADHVARGGKLPENPIVVADLFDSHVEALKKEVAGQFIARTVQSRRSANPSTDMAVLNANAFGEFEAIWRDAAGRLRIIPGKRLFSMLNRTLQEEADINITSASVIEAMRSHEIPPEIVELVDELDGFRSAC